MTTLRTAVQQALEALYEETAWFGPTPKGAAAITSLRAALAQQDEPVQEPVAWIQPDHLQKARIAPFLCRVEPTQRCADFVPLYLAPPQRKPLTEEEIYEMYNEPRSDAEMVDFARAIERAHGIGRQMP